jgi:cell division septum initiation protein DivIVA
MFNAEHASLESGSNPAFSEETETVQTKVEALKAELLSPDGKLSGIKSMIDELDKALERLKAISRGSTEQTSSEAEAHAQDDEKAVFELADAPAYLR